MFAESMRLEPRWAAEFRGFWDPPEDFAFGVPTPTCPIPAPRPGKTTPEESVAGFLAEAAQPSLFGDKPAPSIVCRTSSRKEPMEWQADMFAGYLLMPKEMVFAAWRKRFGGLDPYIAKDEMANLSAKWGLADDEQPTVDVAKEMARAFNVSGQAMQIRLIGLGLIRTEVPAPDLFKG